MARTRHWAGPVLLLTLACAHGDRATGPEPASLVLYGGKIVTLETEQPEVSALAVRGNTIVALGTDEEILALAGPGTRRIDLAGKLATPGFIEGHGHYMSLGRSLSELELRHARDWDEIVAMVAKAAAAAEPGDWIVGRGWHQSKWSRSPEPSVEGLPVHGGLSAVSPRNPVMLVHTSGHGVFANALALEAAGIGKDTADPAGGEIVRDGTGEPTGMLRESAQDGVREALADQLAERPADEVVRWRERHAKLAAQEALRNGITSFQDLGVSFEELDVLRNMAERGELPVRLYMAVQEDSALMAEKLADYRMVDHGNGFLTVRAIGEKVLDGALGTHGGWLLEPYADLPRTHGLNVVPVAEIEASAALAMEHGYQMAIQGIGDRATRELFRIYEAEFAAHPEVKDPRWRIEHAQVIHPDDLPRFAGLGVIPAVQGIFACSDGPWVEDRLGPVRTRERGYQYRTLWESGAVVTNGTDPPVEDIDPIASFACTTTRKLGDGAVFQPEQTLSREQTLRSYTFNNAYAAFEEDRKGTLEVGKLADITVFDRDLLTIPDDQLTQTRVVYTIVDGNVAFDASDGAG